MSIDTPVPTDSAGRLRWRPYHALALLPAAGMLGGLSFANRVYPLVFGLPFLIVWLVGWVTATSAIMACLLVLDGRTGSATSRRTPRDRT